MAQATVTDRTTGEQRLAMTYEEWLAWADDSRLSEWVDGEVTVFMPPTGIHQDVQGFLYILLKHFSRFFDLGIVRQAPFEMRLPDGSSREPDLMFVARDHLDRLTPERLIGPADLVVEVISDDSATRDRRTKLRAYEAAGIPEFWLFDPRLRRWQSHFFQLGAGAYRPVPLDAGGRYHSAVLPGFWLDPTWLWQDPLPDPLDCLDAIAPEILTAKRRQPRIDPGTDPSE